MELTDEIDGLNAKEENEKLLSVNKIYHLSLKQGATFQIGNISFNNLFSTIYQNFPNCSPRLSSILGLSSISMKKQLTKETVIELSEFYHSFCENNIEKIDLRSFSYFCRTITLVESLCPFDEYNDLQLLSTLIFILQNWKSFIKTHLCTMSLTHCLFFLISKLSSFPESVIPLLFTMCLQIAEDRTNPISTRLHAVELMTYFILDDDNWLETISQIVNNSLDYSNWEIVGEQFLLENRYTKTEISEITGALLNEKMIITIRSIFDIELKKEMKSEKIETTKEIGKGVQISDSTISSTTSPSNSSSSPSSSSFFSSSSSSSSSSISVSSSAPAVHLNKSIKQQHPPKRTTGHFLSLSNSLQRYLDVMDSLFEDSDSQQIHSFQPPIQTSSATPSSSSPSSSSSLSSSSSSDPFTPSFSFSSFYVRNYLISILRSVLFGSQPILKLPLPSVAKFKGKKKVPETLYTLTSWKQINIFTFLFWYFLDGFLEDEEISRKEKAKEVEENESKKDETKENLDDLKNELIGVEEKEEKEEKADEEEKLEEQEEQKKECLKDVTDVLDAEESEQHKEEKEASDETSNKQLHSDSMRPNIVHLDEADPLELVTAQQVSKCAHFLVNLIDKSCALKDLLNIGKRRAQDSCARETEGEEAKVSYEDYLANPSKGSKCEAKRHSKETQIDLTPLFFSPEMAHTRRLLPCFDLSDPLSSSSAQADSLSTTLDEAVFLQNESKHRWVQEKELARIKENRLIQWSGVRKGPPLRKSEQKMNALALFQMREGHHSRTHTRIVVDHSSKVWKNRTETRMSSRNKKQEVDSMLDYDDYHSAEITIGKAAKAHDFEDNWSDY